MAELRRARWGPAASCGRGRCRRRIPCPRSTIGRRGSSAVYDLFGNAKTALKFSVNKYMRQYSSNYLYPYSPIGQNPEVRQWRDCDFIPGTATCSAQVLPTNRDDIAQDNEIGPTSNLRFGQAAERRVDPNMQREYDWDYSVNVQHELFPRISVSAGWYTTRSYDAQRPFNTLRSFSDYASFTTTNPLDGTPITLFNLDRVEARHRGHCRHQFGRQPPPV